MIKIHLTVAGCAINGNTILLIFHSKYKKWLFPGGHIERNETPDLALLREFNEETGLQFIFSNFKYPVVFNKEIHDLPLPFHVNIHKINTHYHYCSYYKGSVLKGKIETNSEVKILKWFTVKDIMNQTDIPQHIKIISLKALNN